MNGTAEAQGSPKAPWSAVNESVGLPQYMVFTCEVPKPMPVDDSRKSDASIDTSERLTGPIKLERRSKRILELSVVLQTVPEYTVPWLASKPATGTHCPRVGIRSLRNVGR